ncbi:MAG: EAL domain-containing protein [Massilia sp.]|nr:EAL domain-containing protein [Massilia sp.]
MRSSCQGGCNSFACTVLDALPQQIAVLAADGAIVAVNASWRHFGKTHVRPELGHVPGIEKASLAACLAARGASSEQALAGADGIAAVLAGRALHFALEYTCHCPAGQRWFSMLVTPLLQGRDGAVIAHTDITARRLAEADLRIAAIAFESSGGMFVTDASGTILQVNHAFTAITGYSREEAIGHKPTLLSSGRHDAAFYQAMWGCLDLQGSWEGEIWNRRKNGELYPQGLSIAAVKGQDGDITHYVASLTDITVSKAASDEIEYLAFYDPLTHLPNRRLLLERLVQVAGAGLGSGRYSVLMFIDLDNFKTLNDTLGHNTGDLLLQQVARRLEGCLRQGDTVARLGGDEFVVLVDGLSRHAGDAVRQTETLTAKILDALNAPYVLGAHRCRSTASIGATLFHDGVPVQPEELLLQADIAMYQAKHGGRNGMRFFDQGMRDTITARAQLEERLRLALEQKSFELHYQVQVDSEGRARGAEALLRWRQDDGSFVPPADFIPLAEETGLILPLGRWVLEQACIQLRAWKQHPLTRELVLAVNVSARQFHQAGFGAQVCETLAEYGIAPGRLKLELTESLLLDNIEPTIASMQALKQFGVRFSLDDFGTGYSSLQYLKRLPLDQLKIDQSFVRELVHDESDQAIVLTIVSIARSLGLGVIAEGVETEAQRTLLAQLGCQHYQGYLFARPLPAAEFMGLLDGAARQLPAWQARPVPDS